MQPYIPINQERAYVKIGFYKGQLAVGISSCWIANICARITQNRGIDSVISCVVVPVREGPDP